MFELILKELDIQQFDSDTKGGKLGNIQFHYSTTKKAAGRLIKITSKNCI